jgi:hypothetical protein
VTLSLAKKFVSILAKKIHPEMRRKKTATRERENRKGSIRRECSIFVKREEAIQMFRKEARPTEKRKKEKRIKRVFFLFIVLSNSKLKGLCQASQSFQFFLIDIN